MRRVGLVLLFLAVWFVALLVLAFGVGLLSGRTVSTALLVWPALLVAVLATRTAARRQRA